MAAHFFNIGHDVRNELLTLDASVAAVADQRQSTSIISENTAFARAQPNPEACQWAQPDLQTVAPGARLSPEPHLETSAAQTISEIFPDYSRLLPIETQNNAHDYYSRDHLPFTHNIEYEEHGAQEFQPSFNRQVTLPSHPKSKTIVLEHGRLVEGRITAEDHHEQLHSSTLFDTTLNYMPLSDRGPYMIDSRSRSTSGASTNRIDNSDSASSQSSFSIPSTNSKRSRSVDQEEDISEGDSEGDVHVEKRSRQDCSSAGETTQLYACPYAKFDPVTYSPANIKEQQFRGCSQCFLKDISRVKQHLYRVHKAQLTPAHIRSLKKKTRNTNQYSLWYDIFSTLFPDAEPPTSPFFIANEVLDTFAEYTKEQLSNRIRSRVENNLRLTAQEAALFSKVMGVVEHTIDDIVQEVRQDFDQHLRPRQGSALLLTNDTVQSQATAADRPVSGDAQPHPLQHGVFMPGEVRPVLVRQTTTRSICSTSTIRAVQRGEVTPATISIDVMQTVVPAPVLGHLADPNYRALAFGRYDAHINVGSPKPPVTAVWLGQTELNAAGDYFSFQELAPSRTTSRFDTGDANVENSALLTTTSTEILSGHDAFRQLMAMELPYSEDFEAMDEE